MLASENKKYMANKHHRKRANIISHLGDMFNCMKCPCAATRTADTQGPTWQRGQRGPGWEGHLTRPGAPHVTACSPSPRSSAERHKNTCLHQDVHTHAQSSLIPNSPDLETSQSVSINRGRQMQLGPCPHLVSVVGNTTDR